MVNAVCIQIGIAGNRLVALALIMMGGAMLMLSRFMRGIGERFQRMAE